VRSAGRTTRTPRRQYAMSDEGQVRFRNAFAVTLFVLLVIGNTFAQSADAIPDWATNTSYKSSIRQNIIYQKTGALDLRLDVLTSGAGPSPRPVVIYFHGGGWVAGNKEGVLLKTLPYLAQGMDVVNVEYRLASQALAPAAVEDGRCALHWVARHAKEYGFDLTRVVTAGESAGGHLALMTGMLSVAAGFDRSCEVPFEDWQQDGLKDVKVAAIINFFGIIDVDEFLLPPGEKKNAHALPMPRNFALRWFGDLPDRLELATQLSPLHYVGKNSPPILTAHGDKDPYVPYEQALVLREALNRNGVENRLITIEGGGHGASPPFPWTPEQNLLAHKAVFEFLKKVGVLPH